MSPDRANEIINAWALLSEYGETPTPERVLALTDATWDEWARAHKIVYEGLDPADIDLGFA